MDNKDFEINKQKAVNIMNRALLYNEEVNKSNRVFYKVLAVVARKMDIISKNLLDKKVLKFHFNYNFYNKISIDGIHVLNDDYRIEITYDYSKYKAKTSRSFIFKIIQFDGGEDEIVLTEFEFSGIKDINNIEIPDNIYMLDLTNIFGYKYINMVSDLPEKFAKYIEECIDEYNAEIRGENKSSK